MKLITRVVLILLMGACMVNGQRAFTGRSAPVKKITRKEGENRINMIRNYRFNGDYSFKFQLIKIPKRGKRLAYRGILWGSWTDAGPVTKVELFTGYTTPLRLIMHNGANPRAWISKDGMPYREMTGAEMLEPLIPDTMYTVFDLMTNYIYWPEYDYEGGKKVKGRPAHLFSMKLPEGRDFGDVNKVRLSLDAGFNAVLKAEYFDEQGGRLKTLQLNNFQKVQDDYIIKEMDVKNELNGDKARLRIRAAAMGLALNPQIFDPENPAEYILSNDKYAYLR